MAKLHLKIIEIVFTSEGFTQFCNFISLTVNGDISSPKIYEKHAILFMAFFFKSFPISINSCSFMRYISVRSSQHIFYIILPTMG